MTGIFETPDGETYDTDELQRKEECDFCGTLGEISGDDGFIDGQLLRLSNEDHDSVDICRDCVVEGVQRETLEKHLKTKQEILEERDTVELS